ncbi:glycosyl hydrolase family protein [Anaerolineae bacterium CFX7]|nr:glycosyl hydrolase family protein [Anaerolineae bacterium CFX7]
MANATDFIEDRFIRGFHPRWVRFAIGHSEIESAPGLARLIIDGAVEGQLSDAEIDDHRTAPRWDLHWTPPLTLTVRARFSHPAGALRGTAGFGFWNDPFDWSGNVQAPPNAIWFFYASPESDMAFVRDLRGHGWRAAFLNGGKADRVTMAVGNALFKIPAMNKLIFAAAEKRMDAAEFLLDAVDMTKWHEYKIEWRADQAIFAVDAVEVFRAKNPPNVPLGFVAWVDNNATTMGPGKDFSFTRIAIAEREWMELAYVKIERDA